MHQRCDLLLNTRKITCGTEAQDQQDKSDGRVPGQSGLPAMMGSQQQGRQGHSNGSNGNECQQQCPGNLVMQVQCRSGQIARYQVDRCPDRGREDVDGIKNGWCHAHHTRYSGYYRAHRPNETANDHTGDAVAMEERFPSCQPDWVMAKGPPVADPVVPVNAHQVTDAITKHSPEKTPEHHPVD